MREKLRNLRSKVVVRIQQDGPVAALRHYFGRTKQLAHQMIYDRRLDQLERRPSGARYLVRPEELAGPAPPPEQRLYQAFPRLPFLWSIKALNIVPNDYTFVDYGSGRGRLLLTAARLPFRRIIGVEFARSLHQDACENIAHYPQGRMACQDVASININAVDFDIPEGNVVAFFFNPLTDDILDRVAQRIEASCRRSPRSIHVIFAGREVAFPIADRSSFRQFKPTLMHRLRLGALAPVPVTFFSSVR